MRFNSFVLSLLTTNLISIREWSASAFGPSFVWPPRTTSLSTCSRPPWDLLYPRVVDTCLFTSTDDQVLDANNVELLQKVFDQYSDKDGLMTKADVTQVPAISQLLKDGDLLPEELTEIWDSAPKFPDVMEDRIDVDSFVQIYRTIDDLFENEEEEVNQTPAPATSPVADEPSLKDEESELFEVFASIAKDEKLTKAQLKGWDEIETLIADNMLGEDEFDQLWKDSCKSTTMDEAAFLKFNEALDSLFEFDSEDLDEVIEELADEVEEPKATQEPSKPLDVVEGEVELEELFELLKSRDGVVGVKQLKRWGELQEMIADEEIVPSEVDEIFENALEVSKEDGALDRAGFTAFYQAIGDLFEDDDEEYAEDQRSEDDTVGSSSLKEDLLRALNVMNNDEERLPCGLESTEKEEKLILDLVTEIEKEKTNLVRLREGDVEPSDLSGEWEMLYTSSSAMKFNKGLSGIGGSFPNGKFGGLKQILKATAVMSDVEYREFIEVNPSASSFNVKIDGFWDLRKSTSLFTGEPSIVLSVEPNRVTYGPTSTRADHWKSLGPMNLLDVTYLDDEIRIMRGNTSVETIFVFKRLK
eukprot:scaffold987_cov183-Amphora_coffeaeformis.AAC.8